MWRLRAQRIALVVCLAAVLGSCSPVTSVESVYGTYVAAYPFATETLIISRDGTVVQRIAVPNEPTVVLHGSWKFEATRAAGRLTFLGLAVVANDSEDALNPGWRNPSRGLISADIERHWFRIVIASASDYPYVKQ